MNQKFFCKSINNHYFLVKIKNIKKSLNQKFFLSQ